MILKIVKSIKIHEKESTRKRNCKDKYVEQKQRKDERLFIRTAKEHSM